MKRTLNILFTGILFAAVLTGCKPHVGGGTGTGGGGGGGGGMTPVGLPESVPHNPNWDAVTDYSKDINPVYSKTASASQDFIFNTDSLGFTELKIRRSEWNKLLTFYDYFYKNENSVLAESYSYQKDGREWKLNQVGFRIRGNTSRVRPQGKDRHTDATGHRQMNADWNMDYYNYAATCDDDEFRQPNFKIDFEPKDSDERKLSDCMKGVALKSPDSYFSKEIICYNTFHEMGIWTAPRASQTKFDVYIIEDLDEEGNRIDSLDSLKTTHVDLGVYEMFEEVNKQSLKGRNPKNNSAPNAWKSNGGDLWKCAGGDLTKGSNTPNNFGVEQIEILNTDKPVKDWSAVWNGHCYDLKTNKTEIARASLEFSNFITELNNLSDISAGTTAGQNARKAFYEKWFDVDFFIRTYAVNIMLGMDDDYWGNANNYYLYFDNEPGKGSGKCYLIPFDYDNTLGASINRDKVYVNPLEWGWNEDGSHALYKSDRPLLDRLIEVPEYVDLFKKYLKELSSQAPESVWNKENRMAFVNKLKENVQGYTFTPDIKKTGWPNKACTGWSDDGGWKEYKHYLSQSSDNYFEQVSGNLLFWTSLEPIKINFDLQGGTTDGESGVATRIFNGANSSFDSMIGVPEKPGYMFLGWTKTKNGSDYTSNYGAEENLTVYASWKDVSAYSGFTIFNIPDDTYKGIKVGIYNIPSGASDRIVRINGVEMASCNDSDKNFRDITWGYPFVEPGKDYTIEIEFSGKAKSSVTVTAETGLGEFKLVNNPEFNLVNNRFPGNKLSWKTEPIIQLGSEKLREDDNWDQYFLVELNSRGIEGSRWDYISWNWQGSSLNKGFNLLESVKNWNPDSDDEDAQAAKRDLLSGEPYRLGLKISYIYDSKKYGKYQLIMYNWDDWEYWNKESIKLFLETGN